MNNSNSVNQKELAQWIQDQWSNFMAHGEIVDFRPGQTLFYRGHRPLGIYLLSAGEIALRTEDADPESAVILTADHHPVIGIDFLIADLTYPYTAEALNDVKVVFITRTDYLSHLVGDLQGFRQRAL